MTTSRSPRPVRRRPGADMGSRVRRASSLVLVLALAAGCRLAAPLAPGAPPSSRPPTRASAAADRGDPADRGFYPLESGSRWHYRASLVQRLHRSDGTVEVLRDESFEIATELTCADSTGGRAWVVERTIESFPNGSSASVWNLYRQDRDGLWTVPIGATDPCAGGPGGGPPPPERCRLAYPLHVGASWVFAPGFFPQTETVEAMEVLDLPVGRLPAWRIRVDRPGIWEPGRDWSHVWYGRAGLLQVVTHLEDDVVVHDRVTGFIEVEMRQTLDQVDLAGPGRFDGAVAARAPVSGGADLR